MGLHLGYAIEGAIGSYYKIDASYLSPNVKMAERLEGATKSFGVPLLISGSLYKNFTRKTRGYCRQVDWVMMAGKEEPMKLFTIDVDPSKIPLEDEQPFLNAKEKKIQRVHERIKRNNLREAAFNCQIEVSTTFETNMDIIQMRKPFSKSFMKAYEVAFNLYVKGKWQEAKEAFEFVFEKRPDDPLSKNLIKYMEKTNFVAPPDWKGYKFFAE